MRVESDAAHSTLQRLHEAMLDVQAEKGSYAKLADTFAFYWTPLVRPAPRPDPTRPDALLRHRVREQVIVLSAALVLLGGGISGRWTDFVHRGLVLLVLACPCAIVVATPIPAICAIGEEAPPEPSPCLPVSPLSPLSE